MSLAPMTENHIQAPVLSRTEPQLSVMMCECTRSLMDKFMRQSRGILLHACSVSVACFQVCILIFFFKKTLETKRAASHLWVWVGIYKALAEVTTSDNSLRWLNNWIVWCDESLTAYLMLMWMFHGSVWFTNYKEYSCEVVCADVKFHLGTVCMERS